MSADSFKIEIYNPGINRVILDESSPIYVIPPIRVVGWQKWTSDGRRARSFDSSNLWDAHVNLWQEFELRFQFTLAADMPPLLFIGQNYNTAGYGSDLVYRIPPYNPGSDGYSIDSWISNLTWEPIGSAGHWTGVRVRMMGYERRNRMNQNAADAFLSSAGALAQVPNLSNRFIAAGYGVEPRPGEIGVWIRDANNRIVFNSNSNTVLAEACESRWQYLNRNGSSGTYVERWQLQSAAPSSDAYCLVIPDQRYRRYNGETARVCMFNYIGQPLRQIVGGRSGSPALTPMIWIKPIKPVEYW